MLVFIVRQVPLYTSLVAYSLLSQSFINPVHTWPITFSPTPPFIIYYYFFFANCLISGSNPDHNRLFLAIIFSRCEFYFLLFNLRVSFIFILNSCGILKTVYYRTISALDIPSLICLYKS